MLLRLMPPALPSRPEQRPKTEVWTSKPTVSEIRCPRQMPSGSFPGATPEASNRAWPSGEQPGSLDCWPRFEDGGLSPCGHNKVLSDFDTGWPGQCLDLKFRYVAKRKGCASDCLRNVRCATWQVRNRDSCYTGLGSDCFAHQHAPEERLTGAQRVQHGAVHVLMDLRGLRIKGLWHFFGPGYFEDHTVAVSLCRDVCYSNVECTYWQYTEEGCWVEDPAKQYRVEYPLTTASAEPSPSVLAGELVQHYCPTLPAVARREFLEDRVYEDPWVWYWNRSTFAEKLVLGALMGLVCAVLVCIVAGIYALWRWVLGSRRDAARSRSVAMRGIMRSPPLQTVYSTTQTRPSHAPTPYVDYVPLNLAPATPIYMESQPAAHASQVMYMPQPPSPVQYVAVDSASVPAAQQVMPQSPAPMEYIAADVTPTRSARQVEPPPPRPITTSLPILR
eukprot:NODE_4656_length_1864_cov_8.891192.p1 GENE.NODE_4656_length_1864_cov_8.891192~~NODE_4656_length_1864_cov_8.891192.p1  ORF type:complete len:502 (-),score=107.43 NODE_4656_length_1864_cov_8.891192:359-1696(-)